MNLYAIKCHISVIDNDDIVSTIILNKYKTKNTIFHWSDLTVHKAHTYAFLAHNIYFVWGDIHYDMHCDNFFVDKKINVGCIFKSEFNKAVKNKENFIKQLTNLKSEGKIVTFFSTTFENFAHSTEYLLLEYLEMIREFCRANPNINVFLKPKVEKDYEASVISLSNRDRYKKIWENFNSFDNFNYLDPLKWGMEEVLAMSDVCVNMGINSPSTVALICGKNGLYFDNSGNNYHPFAKKYQNAIVFEDKNSLLRQINNILKGKFDCLDVISEDEIREYDAFSDDRALERIRHNLYELTSLPG